MKSKLKSKLQAFGSLTFASFLMVVVSFNPGWCMPGWAKKAAKMSSKIEIDPRAKYIELLNKAEIIYYSDGRSVEKIRKAYKILSVSGAKDFYFSESTTPNRRISKFTSWTKSPNGKEQKFDSSAIRSLPISHDYTVYMDIRHAYLPYQDLRVGTIIAQEYVIVDNDLASFISHFQFQVQQPALEIELRAKAPKGWKMFASGAWVKELDFTEDGQWYIWKGSNYRYLPDEPLMPPWRYLAKQVGIACYNPNADSSGLNTQESGLMNMGQFLGWKSVSSWVESIYNPFAKPDSAIHSIVDSISSVSSNQTELVTNIAEYVSKQIRYVSVSLGNGRFVPHTVSETLKNGYGDCKDKTTLTRAMLAAAGISSAATLTSIESFVNPNLPSPYQFDHCIVGLPLTDSLEFTPHATVNGQEWLFIDPTDFVTPIGALPPQLMGGTALLANQDDSTFIRLPYTEANSWRKKNLISATIDSAGTMSAAVTVIEYGAFAWSLGAILETQSLATIELQWSETIKALAADLEMSNFNCNCSADSCVVSFQLQRTEYALRAGDELICKVNPFEFANPRLLSAKERIHPIWFGPPASTVTVVNWNLPKNTSVSLAIDSFSIESTLGKIEVDFAIIDSNEIEFRSYINISGELLTAEEYVTAQQFDVGLANSVGRIFGLQLTAIDNDR